MTTIVGYFTTFVGIINSQIIWVHLKFPIEITTISKTIWNKIVAVAINSLQESVWSRLGYSALSLERWELAAKAYRHYTHIEPNGFECWNKSKYSDKEVLTGRPSERLLKKAQILLAQLCVQYPTMVFELSAKLFDKEPLQRAQKLQKAYRTQGKNAWTKTSEGTLQVLGLCNDLCESSLKAYEEVEDNLKTTAASQLSSARLTTQGCIKAANDSEWLDQCNEQFLMLTKP
ncbi:uncharacterized protein LOC116336802 [Contarinia nasturtii]|uniref:uncharacterized protein LOC116336802 n=1 Tax=Contarinia nasturtii TaxID=265458 RepID=UPI0012D4778B|nr:uncharacterized protein LOC116336802 [Contarinia nasturtii]